MAPWKLPLVVAGIALPITAAFALGGPGVGVAVGALAGVAVLVVAARQRPRGPITSASASNGGRHVLLVLTCPVEEPAVGEIARRARLEAPQAVTEVRVLAPARIGFLDRWASDVEPARREAQQTLVATVAALAKAGIRAEARVGDENVVQAVEDQLQSFPATEVVMVVPGSGDQVGEPTPDAIELKARLRAEFRCVAVSSPGR